MALCLLLSLTACAPKAIVRTETVEVATPVIVRVPPALTRVEPEPDLPPGPVDNNDVADLVDALRAWGRDMAARLGKIAGLAPAEAPEE